MFTPDPRVPAHAEALEYAKHMRGKLYRHFKGNIYKVIGVGVHSETAELMVIYRSINRAGFWIRPLEMFLSEVDHEKYPNVTQKLRFEPIEEDNEG